MQDLPLLDSPTNNGDAEEKDTNSTPFVSAPSGTLGFVYSAPASPMHFLLSTNNSSLTPPPATEAAGNEFDFDANCYPMSSADDLFLNGQIRPMKQLELRNRSLRRVKSEEKFEYDINDDNEDDENDNDDKISGKKKSDNVEGRPWLLRNSKRWVSLFLYRSKSEGRNNVRHKYFWSFKDKKTRDTSTNKTKTTTKTKSGESCSNTRRVGLARSEEMRRRTYLPYRQGIFGCIGLNPRPGPPASFNAFAARALNSVSS